MRFPSSDDAMPDAAAMTQDEIHAVLLDILREVTGRCEAHGIDCFLIGGGCLGIVRHGNAFVPWDDDLDLCLWAGDMPRFLAAMRDLPDRFSLRAKNPRINPTWQVQHSGTRLVGTAAETADGVCIDIVPMMHWRSGFWKQIDDMVIKIAGVMWWPPSPARWKALAQRVLRRTPLPRLALLLAERLLHPRLRADDAACRAAGRGIVSGAVGRPWQVNIPRDVIFPLKEDRLHGVKVRVPNDIRQYLERRYGPHYMAMPDATKRWRHFDRAYRIAAP